MRHAVWLAAMLLPALSLADSPSPPARDRRPPAREQPRPAPAERAPAMSCLGRWVGVGRGSSGEPWTIDMRVTAERAARCGTIEYPSLRCGGYLTDCRRVGDTVTWREVYTHNPGTCAPAGVVEGRCDGASMAWTWTGWETVRTRLTRAE